MTIGPTSWPIRDPEHVSRARRHPWMAWLHDLPARLAFRMTRIAPVNRILSMAYERARERHRDRLPHLAETDRRIVETLRRDGICMTSLGALQLADSDAMLRTAKAVASRFAPQARKEIALGANFCMVSGETIVRNPQLFTWGLGDRLLDIAESYLEVPVAYEGVQIVHTAADGREVSTRCWHRDWEDRRMLKVAIYLSDVGPEDGPMEAVAGPPRRDEDGFDYQLYADAEITSMFGAAKRITCTGPVGTVFMVDTARNYHRGRPATRLDRNAIFYSYVGRLPRHPFFCERSGLSRDQVRTLSRDLADRQQATALWRQQLPRLVRLIPSAIV